MTSEEKCLIADCRIMIIGASDFIDNVKAELYRSGFKSINIMSGNDVHTGIEPVDMMAEYAGEACTRVNGNVEKARVFDPFGHGGFDPFGHNKIDPFGQNKNDPCRRYGRGIFL